MFQLAFCEGWNSVVPAVCGAMVGGMYLMDAMSVQAVRLPNLVYRCCSVSHDKVQFVFCYVLWSVVLRSVLVVLRAMLRLKLLLACAVSCVRLYGALL